MTSDRVRVIERAYSRRGAGTEITDEQFAETLHPDFELDMSRRDIEPEVYRGFDGLRKFFAELDEGWESFDAHPQRYIETGGDDIIVLTEMRGRGRGSGLEASVEIAHVWTFRGDKLARMEYFGDRQEALAAAGVQDDA